ncbi:MAG TPA: molybdopterin-dependent oxidoreductase [Methylomirabilota bacterium]|nr:molybdopterin-dependent oxidoreductase [Methylomirabilota bacterium]
MQPSPVALTVNGQRAHSPGQRLLIHVLRELGIRVPTLCHDDRLTPYGGCRMCLVERLDGPGGLVPACSTVIQEGMVIATDSEVVIEARRQQLQLLLLNHRMDCPVCGRNSDCRLQDLVHEFGLPQERLPFEPTPAPRDEASPVIIRDPGRCVVCGRCVRLCEEVQGVAAIALLGRGLDTRVGTFLDRPLDCEFCGQCVNACPVGALVARPYADPVPAWQRTRVTTTCSFCACGCELAVEHRGGRLQRVASRTSGNHNRGKLCVKGWLGLDVVSSPDRLTSPLIRKDGVLVEASWEEALATAADGLRRASGRGRVVVSGGGRLSCEDGYLLQALAREVLHSPDVGTAPVGGVSALVDGVGEVFDRPASSAGFEDLRQADLVLVIGADPTRSHPLVKTELVQAAVQRNVPVVVAHPVSSGLHRHAAEVVHLAPGSEHDLLFGLTAGLLQLDPGLGRGLASLPGHDEWRRSLRHFSAEAVAHATGVRARRIEALTARLATARRPMVVMATGSGVPGDEVDAARAAATLTAVLGAGAGLLVLGGRANVQGLVDVGLHPRLLPGHRGLERAGEMEELTGRPTVSTPGWTLSEWVAAGPGAAAALLLVGVDPVNLLPGGEDPRPAIETAGFSVVVDPFLTSSAARANIVLPVAILSEREGTVVGADGVRRTLRRALAPPPGVWGDSEVLAELARRMGARLPRGADLRDELDRVVGWRWPRPRPRRLQPASRPRAAQVASGFLLDAAPQLFHSGSLSAHSALLQELSPVVAARLNPADALALGVVRGEVVEVSGGRGEVLLRARLDRSVRRGTVGVAWMGSRTGAATLYDRIGDVLSVKVRKA